MPEIKQGGDPITAPAGWTSYLQGQGASLQYTAPEFKQLNHYDKNLVSGMNQEYNRSDNQAWYQQVGNSLVGRAISIAPKIGAGVGALYGIGDALTNQDVSKIWDNPVSHFFQGMDKDLSEFFPNYKSQKYQEGNLLSKLATAGVVDDIFDGAAFLTAAYATGVPVMKGVGSGLESLTAAKSGADGLSKILKYIGGADELAGGITKTSQAATTIFNSFSEASVEAHQSMEELTKQYLEQDPNMSTEDARKKAAENSTGVFGMNLLTLIVPNFIETRNLHGDFRTNIAKARQLQREGKETAELLQAGSKWSKIGTSAFSELSEENMQSAIQKYESQIAAGSKDAFVLENFAKNYIGFIKELLPGVETSKEETDAALAMFIGGLMGGGGAFKSHLNESARYAALPKELKDRYDSIIKNDVPAAQALLKSYQEQAFKKRGGKIVMDPVTGKPEMDKHAVLNGILNQTRNKSFFEASSAATVANDEALHDYNMEMATMAYAHDLATKYADPEDLKDHLSETAKLPHMVDSMAKVQEYIDLYSKVSTDTASVEDFSNEQDAAEFNYWFKSLNYYNQSKAKALEKLKLSAKPESIIAIDNLIKDVQETGEFIKKQRETLKEDFLMQYNPHVANVKKAQDPSLSAEARKAHTYLASEARVINEGWAGLIPNVNTPGLRFQNENELGRKAILEQAIAENPDSAVEEVYTYMDATQDSALPDSATDALYITKQQVIDEITALEDQHRQLSDQEEQTIEESELEGDEYQALVLETATAANERLSEIYQAKGYVAELDKILANSAKRKGVKVLSEDELKVKFFNQAVRDRIDSLYEHYKSNPNNFQESTTLTKFQEDLNLAREAYTMRTDMTSKDDVLDKIKELQSNLDEMYKQLEKNAGNRSLKQRLTVNKSVQALHSAINTPEVLAIVSKYLDPKEYLALQDSLDNDKHYNLHGADLFLFKLRDLLTEEDSKKLQGIFTEIATKYKDELFKEIETTFGKQLVSPTIKKTAYLANPDRVISILIRQSFLHKQNDRIDEYVVDRDLDSLIIDLPHTTISATDQAALKKMYQLHLDISALTKINNLYLNSSVDYMKVLEARALLYKDLKTTGVAPTFQQLLAINQIIESYFTKGANWSNAIVSLGTAGSGKSSVVAKSVVDILKKLDPKFNVYAIGHTEQSSSNINYVLGTKITTRQDFEALSAEKLAKIDLLIIDEIYGLKNADIRAIVSVFKNKILFLGDPAQSASEDNHLVDDTGATLKSTFVQPLTVVYRTNVPVIVEYFNKFRLRSKDVVNPSALVNLPKSEIMKDTSKAVGVLEATEEEILEALKTPSTRSRALVVSSKDQLEKYKDLQGVDVYMHNTIQGLTYDEVFTLIKKEHFNTTENFKIYNQAVFTATSRARFFIMTNGQNTKSIETPSITDNIEVASEEFAKNKTLLLKELENASQFSKLLYSSSITVGTPPAAKNDVDALITDEEEDIDQDEMDAHTQESVVEAETEAEDIETELPKTSTGEVGETLEFPTNYPFSKGHGNLKEAHIKAGSEVYTIRVESNGTFEYHLVGISSLDGTPKSIAVLSENELTNNPLFSDIQSKGEKANKQVDKGRLERTSPEALGKASIKNFIITEAAPATFSYNEPLTKNTNAIEDTLKKFIQDYFSTVPVPAGKSFFKGDGSLDWKVLQDYGVRIVIFKKGAAQDESIDYANNQSVSKIVSGVPYIEFPTDHTRMKTSGKAKSFYIRLSANKFSKSSKYYAPIRAFYDTAKELAAIDPKFSFESKDFRTKIANVWRDTFEVTESLEEGTVKRHITKKADAKSAKELFGIDNPMLDKLLDEFIQMTHGYAKVTYSVRDEEYEDFKKTLEAKGYIVKGKAPQSDKGTGKRFRIEIQKDPDDPESIEYYQTYVVSSTKSAVGQVLNGLANANSYAAGKALNSLTVQNGKVVKMARSIFEQDTANGFYNRWLKAAFIDAIKDVDDLKATPTEIANSSTNQSKEALLIKNGYLSSEELAKKKAEYSVPPINFARLEELVGDSSFDENGEHRIPDENGYYLREPLTLRKMDSQKNYYGVNHWGKSLGDPASRESLSELLGSRFSGFTPTRISVQSTTDAVVEAPIATPAAVVLDDTYGPIQEALKGFNLSATFMSDLSMPLGAIQAVGNVIKYNLAGKPLPKDIVQHELIHVATLDGMLRAHTNKGSEKDILLYKRVQELANIYRKKIKSKDRKLQASPSFEQGEIGFLTEFIANLSNPEFKAQASKIKVADTTLLSAIWTAILDFLGVSPNVYDSLLATLIDYSKDTGTTIDLSDKKAELIDLAQRTKDEETAEELEEQIKKATTLEELIKIEKLGFALIRTPKVKYTSVFGGINKSRYLSFKIPKPDEFSKEAWSMTKNLIDRLFDMSVQNPQIFEDFKSYWNVSETIGVNTAIAQSTEFFSFIMNSGFLDKSDRAYLVEHFTEDYIALIPLLASKEYHTDLTDAQVAVLEAIFNLPEILKHEDIIKEYLDNAAYNEIRLYRASKEIMMNALNKVITPDRTNILTFKREQMNALENLIRSQRLDVRNIEDPEERNLMQDAYAALLSPAKGKGRLILHLMYSEVFPSFDHERKEEEDLIFERDIATKTIIGIKDYTQDKAHIDGLKSLSQEVKEALSYISVRENGKDRWLNPAYTYITALELLSTVNLSRISTDPLRAQLNDFNLYSPAKQAVILKLEDIITNATRNNDDDLNPLAKNIQIFSSKLDVRGLPEYVGVHSGAGIRASIVTSVEEALKADPSHKVSVSPPFKTSEELYKWFQSKDSTLTIGMYNMVLHKHESQNTLRELQNQLGSQKKTELFVASREYNSKKSGWEFRYIRAKDFGISFSIQATVLNALSEAVDRGQLQEAAGGLQIYFGVDSFNKLKSAAPDTKRAGIREIFEKMGLSSQKSAVLEGTHTTSIAEALIGLSAAYDTYWTTVDEEVARDEDGESTVSIDGKTATVDFRSINDFIERKEEQGGRLTTIGLALEAGSEYVRSPSVVDSSGNKYFQYHPSSWSYFVIQDLIRSKDFKGSTGKQAIRLPDYLTTDYFSYNTFMKTMPDSNESISTIYELAEHDAIKQESINQVIPNQRESEKWFHHREFHVGFLSGLRTLNNRYFQYFSPPSDKPKVPVAQVKLLSVQNATEGIKAMIQQVKYSQTQAGTNLGVYENSLKKDPFRNFNVLAEALPGNTVEDKLTQLATYNTDDELNVLTQAVMLRLDEIALEFGKREAELMVTNKDGKTSELRDYRYKDIFTGKLSTDYGVKNATDLHKLYIYNQYVNSYNVNQLVVGDYNMFKNSDDIIKRMAGVFGPGTIGLVHPTAGMKKNFTVAVIKDSKEYMFEGEKPTSVILRELLVPSTEAYKEAIKKVFEMEKPTKADFMKALHTDLDATQIEDLEALFKAFGNKPYESTDGQGFMSVKRFNELNKGFGRAWKAGNIMKPMYYAVHKEDIVREDGTTVTVARPVYLKYSTVVLTDDLVARFPTLKKLKDKMESENGPDEILFESALKVGVPNGTTATFHTAHEEDLTSSTLTLSNEHYRLQHNPFHTTEEQGEVAIFTQLMYFLSMLGTNDAAAQASYEFVADIMNNQLGEWKNNTANLKSYIGNKLNAKGNERAYQLFKEAVSINNPLLEKKAITILASAVEKDVIKTKFSGSKLVLQSAEGISKYTDAELFNLDSNEAENLSFQIENGRLVAEAIVPRNMLTAAQLEMVKQKKPIFLTGDMLGYRIPSTELHSAVALRIVGVYDNVDTNMIIVPKEIVPIHGSDFDVDALYVINRETFTPQNTPLALTELSKLAKVIKKYDAVHAKIVAKTEGFLTQEELVIYEKLHRKHISEKPRNIQEFIKEHVKMYVELKAQGVILPSLEAFGNIDLKSTQHKLTEGEGTPIGYTLSKESGTWEFDDTAIESLDALTADYEAAVAGLDSDYSKMFKNELDKIYQAKLAYKKNFIVETFLETITHQRNRKRMLTPISFKVFDDLILHLKKFELQADYSSSRDLSNPLDRWKVQESLSSGGILTGAAANAVKVVSYASRAGAPYNTLDKESTDTAAGTYIKKAFKFRTKDGEHLVNKLRFTFLGTDESTLDIFDGTINIAIDNLKLQYLPQLNINQNTGSAWFAGLMVGLTGKELVTLFAHPALKDIVSSKYSSTKEALSTLLKAYKPEDIKKAADFVFSEELLTESAQSNANGLEALVLFKRLYETGEDMRVLASFLDIIRTMPTTIEDLEKVKVTLDKIGTVDPETNIIKMNAGFNLHVPNLIVNTPHVAAAWEAYKALMIKLEDSFLLHSVPAKEFTKKLKLGNLKDGDADATEHLVEIRRELYKYYAAKEYASEISKAKIRYKTIGNNAYPLSQTTSWNQSVLEDVNKLQQYIRRNYAKNPKARFIESLIINGGRDSLFKIKMATGSNITNDDLRELEEGFDFLRNFSILNGKIEETPSTHFTDSLVTYAILNYGLNFGTTNFSKVIPPRIVKAKDDGIISLLSHFVNSDFEKERISEHFKISVIAQKSNNLKFLKNSVFEVMEMEGDKVYAGTREDILKGTNVKQEISYDRALSKAMYFKEYGDTTEVSEDTEDVKEPKVKYPIAFKQGSFTSANSYIQVGESETHVYYQKVGKTDDTYYAPLKDIYSISERFSTNAYTGSYVDLRPTHFTSYDKLHNFIGKEIWIKSMADYGRLERVKVLVTGIKKEGYLYTVTYTPVEDTTITEDDYFGDDVPDKTKLGNARIDDIAGKYANRVTDDKTGEEREFKIDGTVFPTITSQINKQRKIPVDRTIDFVQLNADRIWKDIPEDTKLEFPRKSPLPMDKAMFIEHERIQNETAAVKGNITHKFIQFFISNDPKIYQEAIDLVSKSRYPITAFEYLTEKENKQALLDKFNIAKTDVAKSEVVLGSKELGLFGTADIMVEHEDGTFSIYDVKTSKMFDKLNESDIFQYGRTAGMDIYTNRRNMAKLQVLWYAVLAKYDNPDMRFKNLEVTNIPSEEYLTTIDPNRKVEVNAFMEMLVEYLKAKEPEMYSKLDKVKGIFDTANYSANPMEAKYQGNTTTAEVLRLKTLQLQRLVLYEQDLAEYASDKKQQSKRRHVRNEIEKLLQEIINLRGSGKIDFSSTNSEMSWMESWIGSAASSTNPLVQLYYTFLREQKKKAADETAHWRNVHHKYLEDMRISLGLGKGVFNGLIGGVDKKRLYDPITEIVSEGGVTVNHKIIHKNHPKYASLNAAQKAYVDFVNASIESVFKVNKFTTLVNPETGQKEALADKKVLIKKGKVKEYSYTNLDLASGADYKNTKAKFAHYDGFLPKVLKTGQEMREEHGLGKKALAYFKNQLTTNFYEYEYDRWGAKEEAIPMKYLDTDYIKDNQEYSTDIARAVDSFVSHHIYKQYADDVYAMGKAMKVYVELQKDRDGKKVHQNLIDWFDANISLTLLGRREDNLQLTKRPFRTREGKPIEVNNLDTSHLKKLNWAKVIRSMMSFFSGPTMWLKPTGIVNGIFINMFTWKEAIRNSIASSTLKGVDGSTIQFGVKDLAAAHVIYSEMVKDSIQGNLRQNKTWIMLKKLNYLPDNYDIANSHNQLMTRSNTLFTTSTMYMFHSLPEEMMTAVVMIAQLKSMKVKNGQSIWDTYKKVEIDGVVDYRWDETVSRGVINVSKDPAKPEYVTLGELTAEEQNKLRYVYERMHGGYRSDERIRLEYFAIGQAFLQFKRYFPAILKNAFQSEGQSMSLGSYIKKGTTEQGDDIMEWTPNVVEGRWSLLIRMAANFFHLKGIGKRDGNDNESYSWNQLSSQQKQDFLDAMVTITAFAMIFIGYAAAVPPKEENKQVPKYVRRIYHDLTQSYNLPEMLRNTFAVPPVVNHFLKLLESSSTLAMDAFYMSTGADIETYKTQKGDYRGLSEWQRHIHFLASWKAWNILVRDLELDERVTRDK